MPVPLSVLLGVLAGVGLAASALGPLSRTYDPVRTRYFATTCLFAAAACLPATLLPFVLFPDWSLMYLADPEQLPWVLALPALVLCALGAPPLGFVLTYLVARHKRSWLRGSVVAFGALTVIVFAAGRHRLGLVAYYGDFHHGGVTLPLSGSPLFVSLALILPAILGVYAFTVVSVKRHVEQLDRLTE